MGIEDVVSLLPRAPVQQPLKDLGQINQDMAETQRINATRDALRQSTSDAQQLQQQRLKTQAGLAQAMKEAKTIDELPMLAGKYTNNPEIAQKLSESLAQAQAHMATVDKEKLAAQVQRDQIISDKLDAIIDPKNPDKAWYNYQKAAPELKQLGVPDFTSPEQLDPYARQHGLGKLIAARELKNREVAVTEQNAATNATNATTRAQTNTQNLRAKGFRQNPDTGEIEPLPYDELPDDQKSIIDLKSAQTDLAKARAEQIRADSSGDSEQKMLAKKRLEIAQGNLDQRRKQFEARTFGTVDNAPIPGSMMTENGTVVGSANAANVRPTAASKSAAERATTMIDLDSRIRKGLDNPEIQKYIGPGAGRASELEGKIGTLPKDVAEFLNDLKSYSAFQAGLHPVRGLGGLQYFDEVMGGLGQNKDQLLGKLNSNLETARSAQRVGTPRVVQGGAVKYSRTATGPDGHKIGSNDGDTWYDLKTGKKVE